jgi:DNA-binding transcriptional LysR family regulator
MIRIGTSILNPCTVLVDLWNTINKTYPQFKMKMVPFHGAEPCPTVYETLGKDFDVIVGAYERANGSDAFQALKLGEYRFCVTVSREHPLARKGMLSVPDFSGERLVMMQPGISPLMDGIRGYLRTEHPAIQIQDAPPQYTMELFNRCEESGAVLLTLDGWKEVHPFLVTIPVDWQFTIPYGVLYPLKPSNSVLLFVRALQETVCSPHLLNHR